MDYNFIKQNLSKFDKSEVNRYINYLILLETDKDKSGKLKNAWFKYLKPQQLVDIYLKVSIDGLSIDGETITLQYKGKLMVSYNYQAYKNLVLRAYPESQFDIQLVHRGDDFSFRKESGKVIYSHKINDPFNPKPEIIGAYVVIKNKRGEFLETVNMTDIEKMKAVAKTKVIWDEWFSEMVLKSVMKRACKRHFKDIVTNVETIDNENYDLERAGFDETIQKKVDEATTFDELSKIYREERKNVSDEVKFVEFLAKRKSELIDLLPEIKEADYEKAIKMLREGKKINDLLLVWKINDDIREELISKAI